MTKTIHTNKWLRAILAVTVLLGVLLCAFPMLNTKAEEEELVTFTFDWNGGTGINDQGEENSIENHSFSPPAQFYYLSNVGTPPEQGKVVSAWCYDKECTRMIPVGTEFTEDVTAYAKWVDGYSVTVDMTDGAEYNDNYIGYVEPGQELYIQIKTLRTNPLPNGDSFAGVFTEKNGEGDKVSKYPSFFYTPSKDTTLYAYWAKKIKVTFDANGGILLVNLGTDMEVRETETVTDFPGSVEDPIYNVDRAGYVFLGWSTDKNATKPDVSSPIRESGTVYAVWLDEADLPAQFEYKVLDETKRTAIITGYEGKNKTLEIPKTIDGYTITGIDDLVFYLKDLESVTVPDSVTYIGKDAFGRNRNLESVNLPNNLETIDDGAFANTGLKSITIPNSVTKIGQGAFDCCYRLEKVTLPENLTTIEDGTFYYCEALTDFTIPSKVTSIGNSAFMSCKSLKKLTIQNSVATIEAGAFWDCNNLHELTVPASVKTIEPFAIGYVSNEGTEEEYKARHIKIPEGTFTYEMRFAAGDGGPMIYYINETDKTYVIKGYVDTAAEKYANDNKIKFFDLDGKLNGFEKGPDGKWAIYKKGKVDTSASGIFENENGWWRVENGYVNFKANGIYQNEYGWWKTTNGKVTFKETGVFQNENGWWRVKDSKVDFNAKGIYQNQNGWWKTTNGKVTFKETGVFQNDNGWWRVKDSKVDFKANGIYQNQYGWWKTTNGKVTFKENGIFQNENGWWVVENSKVNFKANGFYEHGKETLKATNGKVTFKETGMFLDEEGDILYRVKESRVDTKANGVYQYGNDWYKTTNGVVTGDENGLFKNENGMWYVRNSKVDFDFTGLASNNEGTWYVENGKVDTKKNGKFQIEGEIFTFKNGKIV